MSGFVGANFSRIAVLAVMALVLGACQSKTPGADAAPTTSPANSPATSSIRQSPVANPGSLPISAARAEQIFTELCVQQAPAYSGTEAGAAGYGFVRHSQFETYFHPSENLSVSVRDRTCTMVFASNAEPQLLERTLTSLETPGSTIVFRPVTLPSGNEYYGVAFRS